MKNVSKFNEISSDQEMVEITFEDQSIMAPKGSNLAASLLVAGIENFRSTPVSGAPRAPYCMMGACFDCLVEINGITRQACMQEVEAGMKITRHHPRHNTPGTEQ